MSRTKSTADFITARMQSAPVPRVPHRRSKDRAPSINVPPVVLTGGTPRASAELQAPRVTFADSPDPPVRAAGEGRSRRGPPLLADATAAKPETERIGMLEPPSTDQDPGSGSETQEGALTAHDILDSPEPSGLSPAVEGGALSHTGAADGEPVEEPAESCEAPSPEAMGSEISLIVQKEKSKGSVREVLSTRQNAAGLRQDELLEVAPPPVPALAVHSQGIRPPPPPRRHTGISASWPPECQHHASLVWRPGNQIPSV